MTILQAIGLGALQGLTEFIPVSSSGHLILVSSLLGWSPPGLVFEIVVHSGTVLAVLVYLWRDWLALLKAGAEAVRRGSLADPQARLLAWIGLAAVPAMIVGFLFESFFVRVFAAPVASALFLLVTASLLALAERLAQANKDLSSVNWVISLTVGVAQAVAILPGISRSGATIAAGRWRGLSREAAARFSFLLATPTILGAALYKMGQLALSGGFVPQATVLMAGIVTSTIVGYACIRWLMRYLQRGSLLPFALYCALAGLGWLVASAALGRL